ncbi:MAG: TetR/AcrR family transcriptional regulator [Thermoleophilaceae bacterium]|nr:TetR/AcrR family transcriptional regulator [Thermoleophilaceae bacterium]
MPRTTSRSPRTQQERTETTTAALVDAARGLFAQDGYAATSLDAIAARAGVTKGAVYHHFSGKVELFRAVYAQEQDRLGGLILDAWRRKDDPWEGFEAGCEAFLKASLDPEVQRITQLDAPGAIGWEGMRELENDCFDNLKAGLVAAMDAGRIEKRPVDPLAHLLFGAICEGAMTVARASDQKTAHRETVRELRRMLRSLAVVRA